MQLLTPRLDFGCCAVGSHAEAVLCLKNLSQTSACEVSLVCELKFPGNQAANAIDTDGVKTAEWSSNKEKSERVDKKTPVLKDEANLSNKAGTPRASLSLICSHSLRPYVCIFYSLSIHVSVFALCPLALSQSMDRHAFISACLYIGIFVINIGPIPAFLAVPEYAFLQPGQVHSFFLALACLL